MDPGNLGPPQHCSLPISGQTGLEDKEGSGPKLRHAKPTFPSRPYWDTGKAESSFSQSPGQGMPQGKMPRLVLALNTRPCEEPQLWEQGAGNPRSSHPLICS